MHSWLVYSGVLLGTDQLLRSQSKLHGFGWTVHQAILDHIHGSWCNPGPWSGA